MIEIIVIALCFIYFSCLPEKSYFKASKIINRFPIRFIILTSILLASYQNMYIALILLMCYITTLYNCSHYEYFNPPEEVEYFIF